MGGSTNSSGRRTKNTKNTKNGKRQIKLALGVCTIEAIKGPCVRSLIRLLSSNLINAYVVAEGTLLPHARNVVTKRIYEDFPDFTHALFVDSDQCLFTAEHILRMLRHDVDIIAGVTPTRRVNEEGKRTFTFCPIDQEAEVVDGLIEVYHTGLFFTMVKREVLDKLREGDVWFNLDRCPRKDWDPEKYLDLLPDRDITPGEAKILMRQAIKYGREAHIGSDFCGEDVSFCHRAREAGFNCYIDTAIQVGHVIEELMTPEKLCLTLKE